MQNAISQVNQGIALLNAYEGLNVQVFNYVPKGTINATSPQFVADMEQAKKQVKNGISEIDFKQVTNCINCLRTIGGLCNKY